jgi:uncharacterized membrane protein
MMRMPASNNRVERSKWITLLWLMLACVLGVVTLEVITHLLSSRVSDGLALPGGVIGMLGSLVGLYDIPSGPWAIACVIGNFLFYSVLWRAVLKFARHKRTSQLSG